MKDRPARYGDAPVLVLGSSGFIGRWVARALAARGASLHLAARDVAAARRVAAQYGFEGECHAVDLTNTDAATDLVQRVAPEVVFNLAGYGIDRAERDPDLAERINTRLPEALASVLAARRDAGGREADPRPVLVHVGSALEYGEISGDLAEDSVPRPTTLYGRTKLAGTLAVARVCAQHALPALTARLFTVFGPGEHAGRLFPMLRESVKHTGVVPLTAGAQRRDFSFVEDVAEGLLKLGGVAVEPGEIVNLACGTLTTVRGFVEAAARTMGIPPQRLDFGAIPTRDEEMSHDPVSVKRLMTLIDWKPSADLAAAIERAHRFSVL